MRYLVLIGVTIIIGIFIAIGGLIWYLCDRYCEKPIPECLCLKCSYYKDGRCHNNKDKKDPIETLMEVLRNE